MTHTGLLCTALVFLALMYAACLEIKNFLRDNAEEYYYKKYSPPVAFLIAAAVCIVAALFIR